MDLELKGCQELLARLEIPVRLQDRKWLRSFLGVGAPQNSPRPG
jgi:hypothetical protein